MAPPVNSAGDTSAFEPWRSCALTAARLAKAVSFRPVPALCLAKNGRVLWQQRSVALETSSRGIHSFLLAITAHGLAWPGLVWPGLAWPGVTWPGLAMTFLVLPCLSVCDFRSCLSLSCHVLPGIALPCVRLSCPVLSCFVSALSGPVLPWRLRAPVPCLASSCCVLSYL